MKLITREELMREINSPAHRKEFEDLDRPYRTVIKKADNLPEGFSLFPADFGSWYHLRLANREEKSSGNQHGYIFEWIITSLDHDKTLVSRSFWCFIPMLRDGTFMFSKLSFENMSWIMAAIKITLSEGVSKK